MEKNQNATVLRQETIAKDIYSMWIETPAADKAVPGQFLSLYPKDASRILPRPISICECESGRLRIIYRVVGGGTAEFSAYHAGDPVRILGPLGNGFPKEDGHALLIGGGIGLPPLLGLAKTLPGDVDIVCGFRDETFLTDEFSSHGRVWIATEDGSAGTKGTVIDAIREEGLLADVIYACGPMPMLRAVKNHAIKNGIRAWLSLEERMACGIGACLGCVCNSTEVDAHSLVHNKRVCKDGPVFSAEEVEL